MATVDIIVGVPGGPGWYPVHEMAQMLGRYTGQAPIHIDPRASLKSLPKILGRLPRIRGGNRSAIVIASDPGQLYAIAQLPYALKRYKAIYGWVIDSFWDDRIPAIALNNTYTTIYVADKDDLPDWQARGVKNLGVLPWGTDVWSSYSENLYISKPVDIVRVGRQPEVYDNDQNSAQLAAERDMSFMGRPPFGESDEQSAQNLSQAYSNAKYLLAFSTKVSPQKYTHPTKEYITGRWTDALAHGIIVAGQVPATTTSRELLWDGATIEIDPFNAETGMDTLAEHVSRWNEEKARYNMRMALAKLDWRHRFKVLLDNAGISSESLEKDLREMAQQS
ncbi:MAG: glycosyltransferase [Rothia sp. (in: high G+C Gram-positive bacteria)]|uniref:glycosyltransferase n=1 Tax=Rothia sp. (in: high G+C Gram-positive bacteria) TaxID=1885016 RepID=UPI0026DEE609|nr:glycosyltransferase [Rothia sp. (in: high G+C Gram-positive bacteria)]MDO5750309.1 glycosyltransferase [Rothia sp. (in: high G+C Gram-positive bacteria)]